MPGTESRLCSTHRRASFKNPCVESVAPLRPETTDICSLVSWLARKMLIWKWYLADIEMSTPFPRSSNLSSLVYGFSDSRLPNFEDSMTHEWFPPDLGNERVLLYVSQASRRSNSRGLGRLNEQRRAHQWYHIKRCIYHTSASISISRICTSDTAGAAERQASLERFDLWF